ncbi:MAG: PKD domain-containing protein [Bacteroidetes bacterium]|nr:PKD domain-containing protein [Bacteroidota bacterium]
MKHNGTNQNKIKEARRHFEKMQIKITMKNFAKPLIVFLIVLAGFAVLNPVILAQTQCDTYMDAGPINRTTGYGEENVKSGLYQGLAQRYNNLNGNIEKIKFWGRANATVNTVKVIVYNEQPGSGLPGVILGQTTVVLPADSSPVEVITTLTPSVSLSGTNVTIVSVEPFFTSDDFYIQHNLPGDGLNLWLNLAKQSNNWYKNLANGDPSWDYDFLIIPMTTATITSNYSFFTNGLDVTFTNTSTGASSYHWDFGDGNSSDSTAPGHTYSSQGNYTVVLYSYGGDTSCFDTASQTINVIPVGIDGKKNQTNDEFIHFTLRDNILSIVSYKVSGIKIYDILGKESGKFKVKKGEITDIKIDNLEKGIYFIISTTEISNAYKFIKTSN